MGCCHSDQTSPWPPPPSQFKEIQRQPASATINQIISQQPTGLDCIDLPMSESMPHLKKISQNILENFIIAKTIKQKLSGFAFTSTQLRQIIEAILGLIQKLQEPETKEEKQIVNQILAEAQKINLKDLKFHKILKKFKDNTTDEKTRPESLSRIYHSVANFQKKQIVERQYQFLPQCQKNKKQQQQIKVNYLQTNGYNVLSSQQIEEVIKLEAVGQKIEDFSTRFKFKFDSIRSQSEDINKLLAENFCRYESDLIGLKYDFSQKEILKVAQISRNACDYNDNGVVLLLIYLVDACSKAEKNGSSVEVIQKIMEKSIKSISEKYPPGQGLKKEQKHLEKVLTKLELKDIFSHKSYTLSPQNKQKSLQKIILENAKVAKTYKNDFEELLQKTCLELSVKIKMGLKLDPDRPNQKAMIRIKEKMLIAKDQKNQARINKETIKRTIQEEDEAYKRKVDQLLKDKSDVIFKISDMLRGKCVFVSIPDIVLTIEKIKAFALKDDKKRFRIVQIESRFTNKVPISDVTLKITINEQIVTELQLTIQSNAAAYNFAHKVYELQRAKMFSKIKIVHNYFEEFQGDFKELVIKALNNAEQITESNDKLPQEQINKKIVALKAKENKQYEGENLSLNESCALIKTHSETIKRFFTINNAKAKDILQIIVEVLANPQQHFPTQLSVSTDPSLQDMMIILFNKQMNSWESQLGKQIDFVLQSSCSKMLKAILLNFFFRSFELSKEISHMLQFTPEYLKIAGQLNLKKSRGQNFMLLYLQKVFSISNPFELFKTNARIFYQTQQLQNIALCYSSEYPKLTVEKIVKGQILQENSPETIKFLMQLVKSYFINRDSRNNFYDYFDIYFEMLMKLLVENPNLDSGISHDAKLIRAKKLLQRKEEGYKQALAVLKEIKDEFKKREELQKWLECELLLAECAIHSPMTKNIEVFQEEIFIKVEQSAAALGLQLRGEAVANSEWRIYQQMRKKKMNNKFITAKHLQRAITQSSRSQQKIFVLKMKAVLQQGYKIEEFNIVENPKTLYIELQSKQLQQSDCKILAAAKWKNLTSLNLFGNSIGTQGCSHLINVNWKNLTYLMLTNNNIKDKGCAHLIKGDWKNLTTLNLASNYIGASGCAELIKAEWKNLTSLDIGANDIGPQGCAYLIKANWKNLTSLNLSGSNIEAKGCEILIKGNWPNLISLNLRNNNTCAQGCGHLMKSNWKNLSSLQLAGNNIGAQGCNYLINSQWKYLTYLNLWDNNIQFVMREYVHKQFNNKNLYIVW